MHHLGLLEGKTYEPNFDRVKIFLLEAISFWWPGQVQNENGTGLPLAFSSSNALLPGAPDVEPLVWTCENEFQEGEVIQPLWPELPRLASQNRQLHEFFSWVEILRFSHHPQRFWAQGQVRSFLEQEKKLFLQKYPDLNHGFLDLEDADYEILTRHICQNGFRSLTLSKAALLTQQPYHYFLERWETDQALRLWVAGKVHDKVFEFLIPFIGRLKELNKGQIAVAFEQFLHYIESHEDHYRLWLWSYLENDPALNEMRRRATTASFETTLTLFKQSRIQARQKAEYFSYLFTSAWRLYAGFIWVDSKSLPACVDLPALKAEIKALIMRSIFEEI